MTDQPERDVDPFGLTTPTVAGLRRRPGIKWALPSGRLAAWVADMDFPIAPAIRERIAARMAVDVGYPDWPAIGRSPLPGRFAERMAERYGWSVDADRLHEMADVIQGVEVAIHHLTSPGDAVVVPTPAYPPFLDAVSRNGRVVIDVPARTTADGWVWDRAELDERMTIAARDGNRARLFVLCHPQNPTGHVFTVAELEDIAELAERHDLVVVSDEIHAELVYQPHQHVPFAALGADVAARTVTVTSSSKAFNLAGLRWAILHAGVTDLHDQLRALPTHYLGVPNLLAVEATAAAWSDGAQWQRAVLARLDANRHLLDRLLAERLPDIGYHPPPATYLAWLDGRRLGLGDDPAVMFREHGVELSPGPNFGPAGAGFARLNFATSPDVLDAVVAAMAAAGGRGGGGAAADVQAW